MQFDLLEIAEEAAELAGIELRTGFDWKSLRRSVALVLRDWSNRGYNLWGIDERTLDTDASTSEYVLDPDVIDVTDAVVRSNSGDPDQFDFTMYRMSIVDYTNTPDKLVEGQPTQFLTKRNPTTTLVLYPTPDIDDYEIVYWVLKSISEPTTGAASPTLPARFIPALVLGTAAHLALKRMPARAAALKLEYEETLLRALEEDRDRSSMFVVPTMRGI